MTAKEEVDAALDHHFRIPMWLINVPMEELSLTEKMTVAAVIHHQGKNADCWPFQSTLAKIVGSSTRQLRRNLTSLKKKDVIETRKRRFPNGVYKTTYRKIVGPDTPIYRWIAIYLASLGLDPKSIADMAANDHIENAVQFPLAKAMKP